MTKKPIAKKADPSTTGHNWDGIEEFDNPMPRWWLWTFYLTIIWGIGYTIAYPAWPLITGATPGLLGQSTRADVQVEIDRFAKANAPIEAKLDETNLDDIKNDPALADFAAKSGRAVFNTWCAQCHGIGGGGNKGGYPTLADNDWLWGGTIDDIYLTIQHGIRNTTDPEAHYSQMPAFGTDGLLDKTQIADVVQYVMQISGQPHDATKATAGAQVFADNCVACHGETGTGDRAQGAPNLTDAIWLYGGDQAALTETVTKARFGVMPAWQGRLTEAQIRSAAFYVHGLGGGE